MTPLQQKGFQRDANIISLVTKHRALTAQQIEVMAFRGMRSSYRKARERLQKLTEANQLRRTRLDDGSFAYYIEKRPGQLEHVIDGNWTLIYLQSKFRGYESLIHVEFEVCLGQLRPDSLISVRDRLANETRFAFIEVDRSERNAFTKVSQYCRLYESEAYSGQWWVKEAKRFPIIIIVSQGDARIARIKECIARENTANLRFNVLSLPVIRKECLAWATTSSKPSSECRSSSGLASGPS